MLFFRLSPKQLNLKSDISKIATNSAGTLAVVSDYVDTIVTVVLASERVICRFPEYSASKMACFGVNPRSDNVVIVYADGRFVECNARNGRHTKFCSKYLTDETFSTLLPKQFVNKSLPTLGVVFPRSLKTPYEDTMIFYDVDKIFVFDKSILVADDESATTKSAKLNGGTLTKVPTVPKLPPMTFTKKYEHLVFLDSLDSDASSPPALVAVEVRPDSLESQLPPTLRQKKFGAM